MSKEGVQNHLKNGGPHVDTHETPLLLRITADIPENTNKPSIWEDLGVHSDSGLIQDGGSADVIAQEPNFDVFNFDTGTLALDETAHGDDITGIMVGNFPAAVSIASTEWLKGANCDSHAVVKAEYPSSPVDNVNSSGNLLEMTASDNESKSVARDLGELFTISSVSDINPDIASFSLGDSLGPLTSGKLSSGNCHSSPVSPINFLDETPTTGRSRSYSDTENDDNIATKAFLEELERGSQLTAEDRELMEMSRKELLQAYEFQVLEQDKSNTLLTPQELENLPVQGLEFDEAVESKVKIETVVSIKPEPTKSDSFGDSDTSTEIVQSSMSFISTTNDNAPITPLFDAQQNLWKIEAPKEKPPRSATKTILPKAITTITKTTKPVSLLSKGIQKPKALAKNRTTVKKPPAIKPRIAPSSQVFAPTIATITNKKPQRASTVTSKRINAAANNKQNIRTIASPDVLGTMKKEPPILSIDERNVARVVLTNQHGKEEILQMDSSQLIPVQISTVPEAGSKSSVPTAGKQAGKVSGASGNPGVILNSQPASSTAGNLQLAAVPMLYVKDGCLVIPIQTLATATNSLATSNATATTTTTTSANLTLSSTGGPTSQRETAVAAASLSQPVADGFASDAKLTPLRNVGTAQHKATNQGSSPFKYKVKERKSSPVRMRAKPVGPGRSRAIPEERDKWTCNVCQEKFPRLYKLKLHIMKHTGEKPFKCNFPDCKWAFTTAFKLKRHEECHLGKKDFMCEFPGCGKQFTTVYNLNTHKKSHLRRMNMECETCGERFSTQRRLDYHMRAKQHGTKNQGYECPHEGCGRKFFSRYCMGSHMRVHQNTSLYPCPEDGCDRMFDKRCRLQQHVRSHTGEKPYKCTYANCGVAFGTQSKLKRHARKHTGERRWVCDYEGCGKAFMRSEHLRAHTITHTGEKPFVCTIPECNARFKCKSSLYVHLKRHAENAKRSQDPNYVAKTPRGSKYKNNYNKQLQNALGDLFTLINAEELESLITSQVVDQTMSSVTNDNHITMATVPPDSQTVVPASVATETYSLNPGNINPAELLSVNLDGQQTIITNIPPTLTTLPPGASYTSQGQPTSLLATTVGPAVTNVGPVMANVGPATLTQADLLAAQGLLNTTVIDGFGPVIVKPATTAPRVTVKGRSLINTTRAEGRGKKKKSIASMKSSDSKMSSSAPRGPGPPQSHPGTPQGGDGGTQGAGVTVNPNGEIMTSRAITFRDPETGAIYVQTQLLQDDPPINPDLYNEGDPNGVICLDTAAMLDPGMNPDLPSMHLDMTLTPQSLGHGDVSLDASPIHQQPITSSHSSSALAAVGSMEFTGTTINLQDLE